jgi:phage gp16-like protein
MYSLDDLEVLDSVTENLAEVRQRTNKRKQLEAQITKLEAELAELRSDPFNSEDDIRFFRAMKASEIENIRHEIRCL